MITLPSYAQDKFINIQYAGDIGFLSTGFGKEFNRYSIAGMIGNVPRSIAKTSRSIKTVTLRQTYDLYERKDIKLHFGVNISHILGNRYKTSRLSNPPDNYYSIGSVRGIINLGGNLAVGKRKNASFYLEGGVNDLWIENRVSNSKTVDTKRHIILASGFKKNF